MDELRTAAAEVARRARSVRIDEAALVPYARSLDLSPVRAGDANEPPPAWGRAERAAFWLSLDAINFGSGWFPTLRKSGSPPRSGYRTIATAWRAHCERCGPPAAAELAAIEPATIARILGQSPGHELMALFADSLRDLGTRLERECGGAALALVAEAGGSAVTFASRIGEWSCFADRSQYEELSVPFLKRAQIAACDLERAGAAAWHDAARLTMFADNLVPHVLRLDGVLAFDETLVARIERGELIAHGSPEEVEIRACALHAVELMVAARGDGTTAAELDQLLWHRGQGPAYKARPRHRSRCTAY
ncbi:MAG TPA: queuosine salvage family protein [Solirubrobacteraceae bacterium]|nr:queuosine salvage family protein [Solirubrobacteraceae bacterium]